MAAVGRQVEVVSWIQDPFGVAASHEQPTLVVSMAGYNSCVEAAWFGTPAILCPRSSSAESEQAISRREVSRTFATSGWPTL